MTNQFDKLDRIQSITIRSRDGSFHCPIANKEESQTLTIRKNGTVTFTAYGTKVDMYGQLSCNVIMRRLIRKVSAEAAEKLFDLFETVLKRRFTCRPMTHFWLRDAEADEFVIRYDNAEFFYGMSWEGDSNEVSAVYEALRDLTEIPNLFTYDVLQAFRHPEFRALRHAK